MRSKNDPHRWTTARKGSHALALVSFFRRKAGRTRAPCARTQPERLHARTLDPREERTGRAGALKKMLGVLHRAECASDTRPPSDSQRSQTADAQTGWSDHSIQPAFFFPFLRTLITRKDDQFNSETRGRRALIRSDAHVPCLVSKLITSRSPQSSSSRAVLATKQQQRPPSVSACKAADSVMTDALFVPPSTSSIHDTTMSVTQPLSFGSANGGIREPGSVNGAGGTSSHHHLKTDDQAPFNHSRDTSGSTQSRIPEDDDVDGTNNDEIISPPTSTKSPPPLLMTTMPSSSDQQSLVSAALEAAPIKSTPTLSKLADTRGSRHSGGTQGSSSYKLSPRLPLSATSSQGASAQTPWSSANKVSWSRKPADWALSPLVPGSSSRSQTGKERNFSSAILSHKTQFPASTRYFLTVIPPDDFPCEPPHPRSVAGSSSYSHMRRGALLPLYPTLNGQLYAISREYGLPSIGGLAIYLCEDSDGNLGPRIGDATWQALWSRYFAEDEDVSHSIESTGYPMPASPLVMESHRPSSRASRSQSRAGRDPSGSVVEHRSFDPEATPGGRRTPSAAAAVFSGHARRATGGSTSMRGSPAMGSTDLDGSFNSARPSSRMSSALPIVGRVEWTVEKHRAPWWPSWIGEADISSSTRSSSESLQARRRAQHRKQKSLQLYKKFGGGRSSDSSTQRPAVFARTTDGVTERILDRSTESSKEDRVSESSIVEKFHREEMEGSPGPALPFQAAGEVASRTNSQDLSGSDEQISAGSTHARNAFSVSGPGERFSFSSDKRSHEQRDAFEHDHGAYQQMEDDEQDEPHMQGMLHDSDSITVHVRSNDAQVEPLKAPSSNGNGPVHRSASSNERSSKSPTTMRSSNSQRVRQQQTTRSQAARNSLAAASSSFAGYTALLEDEEGSHRPISHVSARKLADSARRQTLQSELPSEYSRYSTTQRNTLEIVPDSDESMWRALRNAPQPPGTTAFSLSHERLSSHRSEGKPSHYSSSHSNDPKDSVSQWINRTQCSPDLLRRRSDFIQDDIADHIEGSDEREGEEQLDDDLQEEEALLPPQDDVRDVVQLWAEKTADSGQLSAPTALNLQRGTPSLDTPHQTPQTKLLSPIALGDAGTFQGPAPQLGSLSRPSQPEDDDSDIEDANEPEYLRSDDMPVASRGLLSTNDERLNVFSSSVDTVASSVSLGVPRSPGERSVQSSSTEVSGLEDFERALELLSPVASNHASSPALAYLGRRPDGQRMTSRDSLAAAKSLSTSVTPSPRWLSKNRTPRAGSGGLRGLVDDMDDGRPKSTSAAGASSSPGRPSEANPWAPASSGRLADQVMKALSPAPPGDFQPSPLRRRVDASVAASEVSASPGDARMGPGHAREASGTTASEYQEGDEGVEARKDHRRQIAQDALNGNHSHSSSVQLSAEDHELEPLNALQPSTSTAARSETSHEGEDNHSMYDASLIMRDSTHGMSRSTSIDEMQASVDERSNVPEDAGETTLRQEAQHRGPAERQSTASTSISDSHFWRMPSSGSGVPQDDEVAPMTLPSSSPPAVSSSDLPLYGHDLTSPDPSSLLNTPRPGDGSSERSHLRAFSTASASSSAALAGATRGAGPHNLPSSPEGSTDEGPPSIARLIRGQSFSASSVAASSAAQTPNPAEDGYTFGSPQIAPLQTHDEESESVTREHEGANETLAANKRSSEVPEFSTWTSSDVQPRQDGGDDGDTGSEAPTAQQHGGQEESVASAEPVPDVHRHQYEDDQSDVWSQDGSRYSRLEERQSMFGTRSASNSAVSRFEDAGPATPTFFFDQQLTDSRPNSYRISKRYSNGSSMHPRSPLAPAPGASLPADGEAGADHSTMGLGFLPSDGPLASQRRGSALAKPPVSASDEKDLSHGAAAVSSSDDVADELDAMLSSIDAFNHTDKSRPWSRPNSRASTSRKLGDQRSLTLPDLSEHKDSGRFRIGGGGEHEDDLESMTMSTREAVRQALTGSERMGQEQVPSRLSLSSTKSFGSFGAAKRRSQSPRRASSSSARYSTSAVRQASQDSTSKSGLGVGPAAERSAPPRANSLSAAANMTASPNGRFRALPPSPSLIPNLARGQEPMSPLAATFLSSGSPLSGGMGNLFHGGVSEQRQATPAVQSPRLVTSPTLAPTSSTYSPPSLGQAGAGVAAAMGGGFEPVGRNDTYH